MLRAMREEISVGSAMASSKELVCRLCVPPSTAASASIVVRTILLCGSCSVSDTPEVWQWVRSIFERGSLAPRSVMIFAHSVRAARSLATSRKKFMPMPKKKLSRAGKGIDIEPARLRGAHIFHAVGERIGQLLHRRRPGLVHVIARDRDRVELRHVLGGVGDDVADDPHGGLGRIDIGVADHELLEDVVLDGPSSLAWRHALLFGRDDEHGQHRDHRAVHGHRHAHLIERDAVEQDLHVLDAVDGDAGLADIADDARMVAVIAAMGGEIEGDREPLLPALQRLAVEGVALARGGEAGILPDGPGPVGIHGRPHAAGERLLRPGIAATVGSPRIDAASTVRCPP